MGIAFAVVMTGIYPLEGGWTWGGNDVFGLYNLGDFGFSDFAGSGIVHMAGAAATLARVLLLGARKVNMAKTVKSERFLGQTYRFTLGTFILWIGWFGFNGGSVLKLGDVVCQLRRHGVPKYQCRCRRRCDWSVDFGSHHLWWRI